MILHTNTPSIVRVINRFSVQIRDEMIVAPEKASSCDKNLNDKSLSEQCPSIVMYLVSKAVNSSKQLRSATLRTREIKFTVVDDYGTLQGGF